MTPFALCPACERYVKSDEPACPFCQASFVDVPLQRAAFSAPRGSSRAKVFALRAALVATSASVAACGDGNEGRDATPSAGAGGGVTAGAGGNDSSAAAGNNGGGVGGASDATAGSGGDAVAQAAGSAGMEDASGGFAPVAIYGGVFPDPEVRAKV